MFSAMKRAEQQWPRSLAAGALVSFQPDGENEQTAVILGFFYCDGQPNIVTNTMKFTRTDAKDPVNHLFAVVRGVDVEKAQVADRVVPVAALQPCLRSDIRPADGEKACEDFWSGSGGKALPAASVKRAPRDKNDGGPATRLRPRPLTTSAVLTRTQPKRACKGRLRDKPKRPPPSKRPPKRTPKRLPKGKRMPEGASSGTVDAATCTDPGDFAAPAPAGAPLQLMIPAAAGMVSHATALPATLEDLGAAAGAALGAFIGAAVAQYNRNSATAG